MIFLHKGNIKIADVPEKTEKIGILNNHLLKCEIQEELNGIFKLELEIENTSTYLKDLKQENMISVKVPGFSQRQFFRIKIVDENDYTTEVVAYHIFYDLAENLIEDIYIVGGNGQMALTKILRSTQYPHNFTAQSTITKTNNIRIVRYNPVQAILGTEDNTFVNRLGGEITRDNYNIKMNTRRGIDRKITIEYGKNLLGYKANVDYSTVYTRIMPKGANELLLPEKYVDSPLINKYPHPKIGQVELNDIKAYEDQRESEDEVSKEEAYEMMRSHVRNLYEIEHIDLPRANYDVDFVELSSTEEYKNYKVLERIYLGDTISVKHKENGLNIEARVISYVYDCLTKSYSNMELGNFQKSFLDIKGQLDELRIEMQESDLSILELAKKRATDLIHSGFGGYVRVFPDRILIMDTDDPNTAQNIWQWNKNGLGFSSTGIDGEYGLAMTIDGHIVADFITAGTLSGDLIKGGLIQGQYLEINNQTTFADGYNPVDKADKTELETGMKSIRQEFTLKDNQLKSEIAGIDANNNEKISRLIQTINGLNYMVSGVEESLITVSPTNNDDLIVDIGAFKPIVPNMINTTNYKAVLETIKTDRRSIDSIYNSLNNNPNLLGTTKTNLTNSYNTYIQRYDNLANKIEAVDPKVGVRPIDNLPLYLNYYRTALSSLTTNIEKARQYVEDYKNSKIKTEYKADISATKQEFNSEYTKITTQISGVDGRVSQLSTDISNVNQKADNITLSVLKTQGDVSKNKTDIARIDVKANNINLSISELGASIDDKVPKDRILTYINLSKEAAKIKASLIDLDGYVRATQLATGGYGVDPDKVNNGQLTGNTVKTSTSSSNYIHMREQYLRFYNGGLNKMELGFTTQAGTSTQFPYIMMGAGDGRGGNRMQIAKWTIGGEIRYRPSGYNSWLSSYGVQFKNDGVYMTDKEGNYRDISKLLSRITLLSDGLEIEGNHCAIQLDGHYFKYKSWKTGSWRFLDSMFDHYMGYSDGFEMTSPNGRYGFKVTDNGVYVKMFGIWTDFEHIIT